MFIIESKEEEIARLCDEARAQGLAEAIVDEIARQRAMGMRVKAKNVALCMMRKKYPIEEIYDITGVDGNTIKEICEQHHMKIPKGLE